MADDKSKRGGADRRRVARGQAYEVSYFARKHGLTAGQARKIIEQARQPRKGKQAGREEEQALMAVKERG